MTANTPNSQLQDRFVDFAVQIIKLSECLPATKTGNHICGQILRMRNKAAKNNSPL